MKKTALLMLGLVTTFVHTVWAGESGFVNNSDEIINTLTQKNNLFVLDI